MIGAFGTVTKGLLKGLEDLEVGGREVTIQTIALLTMARILRRVLETCCHSNSREKSSAYADVKSSQKIKIKGLIKQWYQHQPMRITEAKGAIIILDFAIQADRKIKTNRTDIDNKRKKKHAF